MPDDIGQQDNPLIGRELAGYRIRRELGHGGMATVYAADQLSMGREVAVKIMRRDLSSTDDTFLARFEREAHTIATLEHVHILPVIDFGSAEGYTYLVMRRLDRSLKDYLRENQPLSVETIARLVQQIASALDYAHERQVIHRDLKPGNILVDEQENCFLADFGIARLLGSTTMALTMEGGMMGTPGYMAPETIGGSPATAASDIYALGIILFEMLYGRLPFTGESHFAVMNQHLNEPVEIPPNVRADLPVAVQAVVKKALAKTPEARYKSAGALAEAFLAVIQQSPDTQIDEPGWNVVDTGISETVADVEPVSPAPSAVDLPKPDIIEAPDHDEPAPPEGQGATRPAQIVEDQPQRVSVWWIVAAALVIVVVIAGGLVLAGRPADISKDIATAQTAVAAQEMDTARLSIAQALEAQPNPNDENTRQALARLLNETGLDALVKLDYDAAITDLERATQLDPTYAKAYYNLGVAYEENKQLEKARQAYEAALAHDDQLLFARYRLGALLLDMGEVEAGFDVIDTGLNMLVQGQQVSEARERLMYLLYATHGRAYYLQNNLALSEEDLKRALAWENSLEYPAEAYYYLAQIYQEQGKDEEAYQAWQNVLIHHDPTSSRQRQWAAEARKVLRP